MGSQLHYPNWQCKVISKFLFSYKRTGLINISIQKIGGNHFLYIMTVLTEHRFRQTDVVKGVLSPGLFVLSRSEPDECQLLTVQNFILFSAQEFRSLGPNIDFQFLFNID